VEPIAGAITPVPGGAGPMTNMMLIRNTLEAARSLTSAPAENR
jgi:methylenetetrahydrofolate dehydrogenase (NADP+)/methenyltetrahydrofolate cyclohydrolase